MSDIISDYIYELLNIEELKNFDYEYFKKFIYDKKFLKLEINHSIIDMFNEIISYLIINNIDHFEEIGDKHQLIFEELSIDEIKFRTFQYNKYKYKFECDKYLIDKNKFNEILNHIYNENIDILIKNLDLINEFKLNELNIEIMDTSDINIVKYFVNKRNQTEIKNFIDFFSHIFLKFHKCTELSSYEYNRKDGEKEYTIKEIFENKILANPEYHNLFYPQAIQVLDNIIVYLRNNNYNYDELTLHDLEKMDLYCESEVIVKSKTDNEGNEYFICEETNKSMKERQKRDYKYMHTKFVNEYFTQNGKLVNIPCNEWCSYILNNDNIKIDNINLSTLTLDEFDRLYQQYEIDLSGIMNGEIESIIGSTLIIMYMKVNFIQFKNLKNIKSAKY